MTASTDQTPAIDLGFLKVLRVVGLTEGVSTILLFGLAMPLKYLADMPLAVTIVGGLHGLLFIALVVLMIIGKSQVPLSGRLTLGGILGAIIPLGPFVTEVYLGRLAKSAHVTRT